ncbi:hypothetical protein BH10PSE15_BH10PSE15_04820 [soil metagenome]
MGAAPPPCEPADTDTVDMAALIAVGRRSFGFTER